MRLRIKPTLITPCLGLSTSCSTFFKKFPVISQKVCYRQGAMRDQAQFFMSRALSVVFYLPSETKMEPA